MRRLGIKAKSPQVTADANGDLHGAIPTRDSDSMYLANLTDTCEQKSDALVVRQQFRVDVIVA